MAFGADTRRHIVLNFFANTLAISLLVTSIEICNNPLEVNSISAYTTMLRCIANRQLFRCTVEHLLTLFFRQVAPGSIETEVILVRKCLQNRSVPLTSIDNLAPWHNRSLCQAQFRMRHNQLRIDHLQCSQTSAGRTRAVRAVKAKGTRCNFW